MDAIRERTSGGKDWNTIGVDFMRCGATVCAPTPDIYQQQPTRRPTEGWVRIVQWNGTERAYFFRS